MGFDQFSDNFLHPFMKKSPENIMENAIPGSQCNRKCTVDDNKICHFTFTLEYYHVLGGACDNCMRGNHSDCFNEHCVTGDGVERGILTVNRQLPGPAIRVCQHDTVIVDVDNEIEGTATTLHWHGLLQKGTPFSDGVPFLTQCPIHSSSIFRYVFHASDIGTHFYHSHAGLHKTNGLFGALIVREAAESDESSSLCDFDFDEFYLLCSDWLHEFGEEVSV
jgi:FtsP/CotA-like multicopper oxidase with cupredoxin domain